MLPEYAKTLEPGDVVWMDGNLISHQALIVDINVTNNTVKIAEEVANHGEEDGRIDTYDLARWAPAYEAVNEIFTDWSDEKKEDVFGVTEDA